MDISDTNDIIISLQNQIYCLEDEISNLFYRPDVQLGFPEEVYIFVRYLDLQIHELAKTLKESNYKAALTKTSFLYDVPPTLREHIDKLIQIKCFYSLKFKVCEFFDVPKENK
jgi:hypothetical protein